MESPPESVLIYLLVGMTPVGYRRRPGGSFLTFLSLTMLEGHTKGTLEGTNLDVLRDGGLGGWAHDCQLGDLLGQERSHAACVAGGDGNR